MTRSFRHRGLRALYEGRTDRRVAPEHLRKLRRILILLAESEEPADMDLPGLRLHSLHGDMKGRHAVWVSGNWHVTFRFEDGDVHDVDFLDYH